MTAILIPQLPATASPASTGTAARRWQRGEVAWFDEAKGFGFITPADGGAPIFVQYSAVDTPGYRRLVAGQPVAFTTVGTRHGPEAASVRPLPIPDRTVTRPAPTAGTHDEGPTP
ncbi:cold shock domain-containing protein [Nocardia aurantia]|uniref:CSD domain-containing protein n=1 Tax=Nocardia aurantia TaxID=2585199 RepID=A0A7K0DJ98_9NOCA|nr:hypothetical protein [Nocardia aurantia]